jgi:hypothetical protein
MLKKSALLLIFLCPTILHIEKRPRYVVFFYSQQQSSPSSFSMSMMTNPCGKLQSGQVLKHSFAISTCPQEEHFHSVGLVRL